MHGLKEVNRYGVASNARWFAYETNILNCVWLQLVKDLITRGKRKAEKQMQDNNKVNRRLYEPQRPVCIFRPLVKIITKNAISIVNF